MKIRIDNCILSFPVLFNAQSFRDSDPAFSATFIVDENTKFIALDAEITGAFDEFQRAVQETAGAKWGAKARAVLKTLEAQDRLPYHDGNMKSQYEGFEGHMYLSARSASRPMLLDRDGSALSAEDGKLYAGARVNARINLWAQDNAFGKRVNATLKGVQFRADDTALGGDVPAELDEFQLTDTPDLASDIEL